MKLGFLVGAAVGLAMGMKATEKHAPRLHGALRKVRSLPIVASSLDAAGEKVGQAVRVAGNNLTERAVSRVQQSVFGMKDPSVVEPTRVQVVEPQVSGNPKVITGSGSYVNETGISSGGGSVGTTVGTAIGAAIGADISGGAGDGAGDGSVSSVSGVNTVYSGAAGGSVSSYGYADTRNEITTGNPVVVVEPDKTSEPKLNSLAAALRESYSTKA